MGPCDWEHLPTSVGPIHIAQSQIVSSPMITQRSSTYLRNRHPREWHKNNLYWSFDDTRHKIRCAYYVKRDPIFRDMFGKLAAYAGK